MRFFLRSSRRAQSLAAVNIPKRRMLAQQPELAKGTQSSIRINRLLDACGLNTYLEIGVRRGKTIEAVRARERTGVDPMHLVDESRLPAGIRLHTLSSDNFFERLEPTRIFDFIFLDGLHEFSQSYRDAINSIHHLSAGGLLLIDDVVPESNQAASPTRTGVGRWMGDTFKTALLLAEEHPELAVLTLTDAEFRAQMLVWRVEPLRDSRSASAERIAAVAQLEYSAVFLDGLPASFAPSTLEMALERLNQRSPGRASDDG